MKECYRENLASSTGHELYAPQATPAMLIVSSFGELVVGDCKYATLTIDLPKNKWRGEIIQCGEIPTTAHV
ncbi:MAG: hypothetical protein H8M99_05130 [Gloeobacteraceae cyanobacterium ES-bin-144]|nr:hypothetical protein [Verrucomicrobiales bacterium]